MIEAFCVCAAPKKLPETAIGKRFRCPDCSSTIQIVCGEQLSDGNGAGDFDAGLTVTAGPSLVGARLLLGGVAEINIGKLPDRQIVLPGVKVSRGHCKLQRLDFGPSRWKLIDNKSTNGLFVNGQRVTEHDLQNDDVVTVGEYELKFSHFLPAAKPEVVDDVLDIAPEREPAAKPSRPAAAAGLARKAGQAPEADAGPMAAGTGGPVCPSCDKTLSRSAKICVGCGIDVATGRPVLTSQGVDEDSLYESARQWIRLVSLLMWVTPMPIPIRSQAFGTRKPCAIWTIAAATILASIAFFIAQNFGDGPRLDRPGKELMLWSPNSQGSAIEIDPRMIHSLARKMTQDDRETLRDEFDDAGGKLTDDELISRKLATMTAQMAGLRGEFHWYQLITHAFLHDTSSITGFIMHLLGNLLFMMVFGTRVNALIGNIATAVLYPVLAVAAAAVYLMSQGNGPPHPMLGASGAIMGLAGMYLILFPVHKVFCAMWISLWFWFRRILFGCKIFQVRGFWILLMYFAYDVVMNALSSGGGVAHMAHIGGFLTGAVLGLGILLSRQWNTHGGDMLSVTLGKHAWPLIGKPSRWNRADAPLPRAVSLSYS